MSFFVEKVGKFSKIVYFVRLSNFTVGSINCPFTPFSRAVLLNDF